MKRYLQSLVLSLLAGCFVPLAVAQEAGYIPLLEGEQAAHWRFAYAPGGAAIRGGVLYIAPAKSFRGIYWYARQEFADFVLKFEFRITSKNGNSGVELRRSHPDKNPKTDRDDFYHVDVSVERDPLQASGAFMFVKAPQPVPEVKEGWNEMEITAHGQRYEVAMNGLKVNELTGQRRTSGFIAIQLGRAGVEFRKMRIKELRASPLTTVQTDVDQPRLTVLSSQAPNVMEWILAALDEPLPPDIRQNLTYLREELLDEQKDSPKGSSQAYLLGAELCEKLLAAIEQRTQASAEAGYASAQAEADRRTGNRALEARRNHQMSWPQYAREESQRSALRESESDKADVKKQQLKVHWATRSAQMRQSLESVYRRFREALR